MKKNEVKTNVAQPKVKRVHNLIIVDESGSMSVIRKQAFAGMNETLQTVRQMQEKFPEQEQRVTLITFDSDHTKLHYDNTPAGQTKDIAWKAYNPCAGTPLYDAIGKGFRKDLLCASEVDMRFHGFAYIKNIDKRCTNG